MLQRLNYLEVVGVCTTDQGDVNIALFLEVSIVDASINIFRSLICPNGDWVVLLEQGKVNIAIRVGDFQDSLVAFHPLEGWVLQWIAIC